MPNDPLVPYEAQTEIYQLNQDGLLVQSTGTILRPSHGFIRQIFAQEIMIDSVAWWYTRRDFLDAAAHIALQAFRLAPRNEIVAWRTARILKATGDLARASAVLRAAVTHEKSTWRGVLLKERAFVELDRGKTTKANHIIESLVARFPKSGYVQSLVLVKARTRDWDHAEQALSRWLAMKPSTGAVRWLQDRLEEHPDSDPRYARLMKQIAEWTQRLSFRVHETLQQWIIFFKNSRLARVTANLINFLGGVIVALAVGAGVVVGIIQWQPDAAHTLKVDTLAEYAQTFLEHRLVQRTIDKLEGDLQHDPYDAYAILRRGKAYLDIGKYAEAIADFTRLIEMRQEWLLTPGTVNVIKLALG